MGPTQEKATLIFRAGVKVEVSLEEEEWRDVWFPATIVKDLSSDLFLVEYNWSGSNGESKLRRVTVDHFRIRPSVPHIKVTSFGLLEKVDAFVGFAWWSGVITKKLVDSRYVVFFKNSNKVKEFSHLELRPHVEWKKDKRFTPYEVPVSIDVEHDELRETVSLNFTNTVEDTTTCIDKRTSIVTTSMKRAKPTNPGSNSKPSKKSKVKEASNPAVGQTFDKAENLSGVKKKRDKQEKGVELKRSASASAKKKGSLSADSKVPKTLPQAAGDSTLTTTPNIVEKKHVDLPIPVILGLQCYVVTVSQSKKSKPLTPKSPQNVVEPEEPQSGVPLLPKATGDQERKEIDGDTTAKKKRGRLFKTQPNNLKASLAVNNQNEDASVEKVPDRSGVDLPLQQEKYDKPVKGKRAKRRMISLNGKSSPQDVPDSSNEKENGNSESNVEKSLDTVSDDQPLSRWFPGKQSLATPESTGKKPPENSNSLPIVTNGDGQALTFVKRSALWETIESMEAFRLFPQKPHFRPLDNIKESARERHAINKMVDFSGVFEDTRRLRIDHSRTEIEDELETLSELETHGFDVDFIRNKLMELISFKEKREGLESRSKEVKVNIDKHHVEVQKLDKEIASIDKQVSELLEKREQVSKEKEKQDSEIVGLEGEIEEIEEGMHECRRKFDELATASFV
ncbi:hypothetical protein M8C21_013063 [Ambrosia artemisiifolia]|uniref:Agenet domain-containing protein n=1 Tax=Ambrosia artemisiifolia TaxID=4212 RepID=A0AAD5GSB5_AMBAR|nr:hypothetical protein M8C21_013063 [Ambrosia artemisiifolia]